MKSNPAPKKIAFLGPQGTYSSLALKEHFEESAGVPCASIAEVFHKLLNDEVDASFLPIDNIEQGPVTETLDLLLKFKGEVFLAESFLSKIDHVLGAPNRLALDKVEEVFSHPQPLGQCTKFISQNLTRAKTTALSSTAASIEHVLENKIPNTAVIAAESALLEAGFEIIQKNISDNPENKTRFVLVKKGSINGIKSLANKIPFGRAVTSIAINPGADREGLLFEILKILSIKHSVNLLSIHSRPDSKGGFIFYLDLEEHLDNLEPCFSDLENLLKDIPEHSGELIIFGSYERESFKQIPFTTVGIIGGKGIMGQWFEELFKKSGLNVLISDTDTELKAEELAKKSDVIVFSLPMSEVKKVAEEICPKIAAGKLVIENCSIKNSSIPFISKHCKKGVEVLGLHTMFAGDVESIHGQNIIITKTESSDKLAEALESLLYKRGAKIHHADANKHDEVVSFLQSLFQFSLVTLAEVLRENFKNKEEIESFSTPNSRMLTTAMERVLNQSDKLLVDMQMLNDKSEKIRADFKRVVGELTDSLNKGDKEKFLESAKESKKFLG